MRRECSSPAASTRPSHLNPAIATPGGELPLTRTDVMRVDEVHAEGHVEEGNVPVDRNRQLTAVARTLLHQGGAIFALRGGRRV